MDLGKPHLIPTISDSLLDQYACRLNPKVIQTYPLTHGGNLLVYSCSLGDLVDPGKPCLIPEMTQILQPQCTHPKIILDSSYDFTIFDPQRTVIDALSR